MLLVNVISIDIDFVIIPREPFWGGCHMGNIIFNQVFYCGVQ